MVYIYVTRALSDNPYWVISQLKYSEGLRDGFFPGHEFIIIRLWRNVYEFGIA